MDKALTVDIDGLFLLLCLFLSIGSVSFTPNTITWFLPRHIDPSISSGQFKLLEVHMGVNGQRLEPAEMARRRYSLTVNDVYIITEIPIGADGGYFKVSGAELLATLKSCKML